MAKTQIKQNRFRRLFSWYGYHKVFAAFSVLILFGILYFVASSIIWNLQVRAERQEFAKTSRYLDQVKEEIDKTSPTSSVKKNTCEYRGDTGFGEKWLSCTTGIVITYENSSLDNIKQRDLDLQAELNRGNVWLKTKEPSAYYKEIALFSFVYQKLNCTYAMQYDQTKLIAQAAVNCSKDTLTNYYPTVKD